MFYLQKMKDLVRQYNLDNILFSEMEDEDSEIARFTNSFTLNFIAKNLSLEKRPVFTELLMREEEKAWDFAKENIADFELKFAQAFEQKWNGMKTKILMEN